jgi:hypothetical protein
MTAGSNPTGAAGLEPATPGFGGLPPAGGSRSRAGSQAYPITLDPLESCQSGKN